MGGIGTAGRERRHYDRFNINLPLEATFEHGGSQCLLRSRSINVSAGGAFFPSTFDLRPGTFVGMRIKVPAGSLGNIFSGSEHDDVPVIIRTSCEVVHSSRAAEEESEYRLGVRFNGPMRISPAETGRTVEELLEAGAPDADV